MIKRIVKFNLDTRLGNRLFWLIKELMEYYPESFEIIEDVEP